MLFLVIHAALCIVAYGRSIEDYRQRLLTLANPTAPDVPLDWSIVQMCPESRDDDILSIERIINRPLLPILYVLKGS